jgi:hypothetical protein
MSKPWKIILAVGVVLIIIGLCLGGLVGLGYNRMQNFEAFNRASPEMPRPPGAGRSPRFQGQHRFSQDSPRQLEVQLFDDDGDGIPDRGVVDVPAGYGFASGDRFGPGSGHEFMLNARPNNFPGNRFGPFALLGALFPLAVLGAVIAGAVVLGLVLYRRWRPAQSAPAATTDPEAPSSAPEAEIAAESGEPAEEVVADTPLEATEPEAPDKTEPPAVPEEENLEDESLTSSETDASAPKN